MPKKKITMNKLANAKLDLNLVSIIIGLIGVLFSITAIYLSINANKIAEEANDIALQSVSADVVVTPRTGATDPMLLGCKIENQFQLWSSINFWVRFTNSGGLQVSIVGYNILESEQGGKIDRSINLPFGYWRIYEGAWTKKITSQDESKFVYFPDPIPPGESEEWLFETRKILATTNSIESMMLLIPQAKNSMPSSISWQFNFGNGENISVDQSILFIDPDRSNPDFNETCEKLITY